MTEIYADGKPRDCRACYYLLASLYNATLTISNYFDALVRHDMANGVI